ncbi:endonuclease-reverse transcriptase [Plakobranchus ocellatus]|uniref:Endonuclease-reverse transcriptase n=1 Tax=Plakobranchus ocellatus TaxID=259542 RepID=A0AAV4B7B1_9GAST|nr:endonuclease-reverse transcriptase [Plakobranchus ocellatus]
MIDKADSNRPERRSALIAHELSRLNIDIAALSEVRFADEGNLREHGAGYTLYWSGKSSTERRLSGVGFMMKNSIATKLETLPRAHSDRIISMRLPLEKKQHLTIFSVYAPTLMAEPADKDSFYTDLRHHLNNTPVTDKILILGDFNARVGKDFEAWKGVIGRHGIGNCNDNGRLLLEFCTEYQLTITNSIFQQKNHLKTTWMHPRSKHWHLLDYVLVRQRDLRDVLHTRVMPSAECHTDHRLVRCKLKLQTKPKPKKKSYPIKAINVCSLSLVEVKTKFQMTLQQKLEEIPPNDDPTPDILWENMKSVILKTSEVLGHTKRKNKDWFDENDQNIQKLLANKRAAHQAHLANPHCSEKKTTFRQVCYTLQRKLREMQNDWWTHLAWKTQSYADMGDYRSFYEALKTVYGPSHQVQSPLRSSDGLDLLTDSTSILTRWSEHFQNLFSANRTVQDTAMDRIPQLPLRDELDEIPSLEETIEAISQLKSRKAAGVDSIPPEIWKDGGPTLHIVLHNLLVCCWEKGLMAAERS